MQVDHGVYVKFLLQGRDATVNLTNEQIASLINLLEKEINQRHALIIKLEMSLEKNNN